MSFNKRRELVSLLMRVMVGFILIYSGYTKISEPFENFYLAILSYKVVGERIAYITAKTLPWIEVYLGVFLVFGLFLKEVAMACFSLFAVFELLLLQAIIRKLEIASCGCFGSSHSNPIGVEFALNVIWLFFLYMSFKFSKKFSLDFLLENKFGGNEKNQ
ncbi:MAG: DoxX family membrane protein [Elusimicrobiota bacterium]